jgi:hypothetical protein
VPRRPHRQQRRGIDRAQSTPDADGDHCRQRHGHRRAGAAPPEGVWRRSRNTILFAGFQAGGTRGAAMLGGATEIKIYGEYVPLRASVYQIDNLSAHADADEILQWLRHFKQPPKRTFITHGEPAAATRAAPPHRGNPALGLPRAGLP